VSVAKKPTQGTPHAGLSPGRFPHGTGTWIFVIPVFGSIIQLYLRLNKKNGKKED
jgi:hypothetical protein